METAVEWLKGKIIESNTELKVIYDHWQGNGIRAMNYDTREFSSVPLYGIVPIKNVNDNLQIGQNVEFELIGGISGYAIIK